MFTRTQPPLDFATLLREQAQLNKRLEDRLSQPLDAVEKLSRAHAAAAPPPPAARGWHVPPPTVIEPVTFDPDTWPTRKLEPPLFDGANVTSWIARVQHYYDYCLTPLADRLYLIQFLLDDAAAAWFNYWETNNVGKSWDKFLIDIKLRFDRDLHEDAVGQVAALHQTGTLTRRPTSLCDAKVLSRPNTPPAVSISSTRRILGLERRGQQQEMKRNASKMISDEQFPHAQSDPRFMDVPNKHSQITVDSRFQRIFIDRSFISSSAPVDKRGEIGTRQLPPPQRSPVVQSSSTLSSENRDATQLHKYIPPHIRSLHSSRSDLPSRHPRHDGPPRDCPVVRVSAQLAEPKVTTEKKSSKESKSISEPDPDDSHAARLVELKKEKKRTALAIDGGHTNVETGVVSSTKGDVSGTSSSATAAAPSAAADDLLLKKVFAEVSEVERDNEVNKPQAQKAFGALAKAQQILLDQEEREYLLSHNAAKEELRAKWKKQLKKSTATKIKSLVDERKYEQEFERSEELQQQLTKKKKPVKIDDETPARATDSRVVLVDGIDEQWPEEKVGKPASFKEESNKIDDFVDQEKKALDELNLVSPEALNNPEVTAPPPPAKEELKVEECCIGNVGDNSESYHVEEERRERDLISWTPILHIYTMADASHTTSLEPPNNKWDGRHDVRFRSSPNAPQIPSNEMNEDVPLSDIDGIEAFGVELWTVENHILLCDYAKATKWESALWLQLSFPHRHLEDKVIPMGWGVDTGPLHGTSMSLTDIHQLMDQATQGPAAGNTRAKPSKPVEPPARMRSPNLVGIRWTSMKYKDFISFSVIFFLRWR